MINRYNRVIGRNRGDRYQKLADEKRNVWTWVLYDRIENERPTSEDHDRTEYFNKLAKLLLQEFNISNKLNFNL